MNPQQRQTIPARLLLVGLKPALQLTHPRPQLRQRLDLALVAVRGLITPNHLAHRVLRNPQIPCDLLDRNAPHQMIPTDPRNRLHNQHLPHLVCPNNEVCSRAQNQGGQFWTPITPNRGSIFHAEQHSQKLQPGHRRSGTGSRRHRILRGKDGGENPPGRSGLRQSSGIHRDRQFRYRRPAIYDRRIGSVPGANRRQPRYRRGGVANIRAPLARGLCLPQGRRDAP